MGRFCTGAAVLLVIMLAGACWRGMQERQRLIDTSFDRMYLSAAAYAQAAERWLSDGDMETLLRVSQLMLTGGTRLIEIVAPDQILVELRASGLPAEVTQRRTFYVTDTPMRSLRKTPVGWMVEVVIPLDHVQIEAREIRVWMDASALRFQITASFTRAFFISIVGWLAISAILYVVFRPHRSSNKTEVELMAPYSRSWVVDSQGKRISLRGRAISLTPKQYALLSMLISEGNRVFSEEEILQSVWPHSSYADSNDIRQCVYKIRRRVAIVAPGAEACIVNEKGFGYRFDPAQFASDASEAAAQGTGEVSADPSKGETSEL